MHTRPPTRFESLPVEILQLIFLHSLELNLPKSSIYLLRCLSDPIIYTWLVRLSCTSPNPNPSYKQSFFTADYLPRPLDFFALSSAERAALQTSIYTCGWCTLSLIRDCQRQHILQCIRRVCHDFQFSSEDGERLSHLDDEIRQYHHQALQYGHDYGSTRTGKGDLTFLASLPSGKTRKLAIWPDAGAFQIRLRKPLYLERDIFQLPAFGGNIPPRVPDRLLVAPWTGEKMELLRILAAEAYIDDEECARSDIVLRRVIRERDFDTFAKLAGMRIATWAGGYTRWPVKTVHFQLALKYADQTGRDLFVGYLVDERWEEIPSDRPKLKNALLAKSMVR